MEIPMGKWWNSPPRSPPGPPGVPKSPEPGLGPPGPPGPPRPGDLGEVVMRVLSFSQENRFQVVMK